MNEQTPAIKTNYCNLPMDVEGFDSLAELALDPRWSWNHATDDVWRQLRFQRNRACDPNAAGLYGASDAAL